MFDLEAGVHFQEEKSLVIGHELHRPGAGVAHSFGGGDGGGAHGIALGNGQAGCRGFLDHLLVAALGGAVALEQMQGVAVGVGEDLHFDVAGALEIPLDQHAVVAERRGGFLPGGGQCRLKIGGLSDDPHAAPAAAGNSLDDDGKTDFLRLPRQEVRVLVVPVISRQQRHA